MNGYAGNNNLFSPTAPHLTNNGFSYTTAAGNFNVRNTLEFDNNFSDTSITFSAAEVPEPSDIGGLAILVGMGGLMVRKFKTSKKTTTFLAETKKETLVS